MNSKSRPDRQPHAARDQETGGAGATHERRPGVGSNEPRPGADDTISADWQAGLAEKGPPGDAEKPPVDRHEHFVSGVYASLDEATAGGLARLRSEKGVTPSCRKGCHYCCRYLILVNIAEAHALTQHIRREWSADRIDRLQARTRRWLDWDNSRPGRFPVAGPADFSVDDHYCPVLEDGDCGAYAARPLVCRTHYVSSPPLFCSAASDPDMKEPAPVVMSTIVAAGGPFTRTLREYIENTGTDFSRTSMLLPHWLAVAMDWDFAIL